jgi:glycosyltransferase involved in cell wall biosynthesis
MLEAFCCGLPVIATRVGGIEYHLPSTHGILVESENEEHLLVAMENLFNLYSMFNREAISASASALYSMETIGIFYEKVYSLIYPHLFAKTGHLVG